MNYLEFESELAAQFTQDELEAFEASGSSSDRSKVIHKRLEAKAAWEEAGNTVPPEISFGEI